MNGNVVPEEVGEAAAVTCVTGVGGGVEVVVVTAAFVP